MYFLFIKDFIFEFSTLYMQYSRNYLLEFSGLYIRKKVCCSLLCHSLIIYVTDKNRGSRRKRPPFERGYPRGSTENNYSKSAEGHRGVKKKEV